MEEVRTLKEEAIRCNNSNRASASKSFPDITNSLHLEIITFVTCNPLQVSQLQPRLPLYAALASLMKILQSISPILMIII